jgi:hypothetical protein
MDVSVVLYSIEKGKSHNNKDKETSTGKEQIQNKRKTSEEKILGGGGDFLPWSAPQPLYKGYLVSFPGVKRPGRGVNHPPPSSTDVQERLEMYFYTPSEP